MLTDSEYDFNDLTLSPLTGLISAIVGAFLMLSIVLLLQNFSGISLESVLNQYATLILPKRFEQLEPTTLMTIGLIVHLVIRGLIGVLYSLSLQKVPTKGYIAIGIFFGFFIWILGSVIPSWFLGEQWRIVSRSWTWLLANIVFGMTLAITAIIVDKLSPVEAVVVPKD